ncbi:uncharacterized protein [Oryza sativa Japonica Group]|uniref:OSJNBa0013A04.12 protein n=3 Tax=Oryza TaxID=4527 RepID=Q0JEJ2_ORYSJ|nr:uncharacterized protein LOC4335326 [Oryza sativa Japonica Group]EAZ29998.1 hypothetical protein OsJ_14061 [Oryza sativa Japonica Group]CAE05175.2 OSJNBa0013A04.12 [Oryza sativa Japonica Group]BAF14245.1 Os04g0261400 [Oryza sativa Japonica Group]BAG98926.1 unnamed protein product [Oryza sativa Japonica Group]BAS88295.1 Os04g0261400 [Oryza sativa Japonica Group]|eukprot:NP_001052331.1 Os04g0261400 [Oryza sativa Japonica Group]
MSAEEAGGASAEASGSGSAPAGAAMVPGGEEAAARKRYDALMQVRAKAVKGKGAWYWAHLEPVLVPPPGSGVPPKAARLRCVLCAATFSASNPSRTASEHLKRGACPNFAAQQGAAAQPHQAMTVSAASSVVPISSIPPSSQRRHSTGGGGRKRHALAAAYAAVEAAASQHVVVGDPSSYSPTPPTPPALPAPRQVLSGGRGDLGALARLEDSVKRLKSPVASPGAMLPRQQAEAALALLAEWFLESSGSVSLASAEHPKLKAFLRQVGLPELSRAELAGARLNARFAEARADAAARIREARFFQLAADGWREQVVTLSVNLPNGASVFERAVPTPAPASSDYAEQLMLEAISSVSASSELHHCAGIVADRFGSKALRDLEHKHPWMLNLACQVHGLSRLVRDMARELPLFHSASANCAKMAAYFNAAPTVRALLHKHQVQEHGHAMLLRVAAPPFDRAAAFAMLEDILTSARPLQLAVHEESYKLVCIDDPAAREVGSMVQKVAFWTEVEAAHSLVKLITDMVKEMEAERPLVGQCLPLWEDLRGKVRGWCRKFNVDEGIAMNVVEVRFRKSYHPAWSAAFILDPLYLIKDVSGRYLPPFKYLTPEQDKDVDRLITRLVSPEEAHLALMELMKWRSEGLDPLYAQAVQVRQPDPSTGKMRIANKQSSRLVWETCLSDLKSLGKVAVRLIFLHATAKGFRCAPPMSRWLTAPGSSAAGIARAQRLVYVAANSKLERRDFSNDDDKDLELLTEGDDDMLTEATASVDPSSV